MHRETKNFIGLTLLWYLLYDGGLELNLHYLQSMPLGKNGEPQYFLRMCRDPKIKNFET